MVKLIVIIIVLLIGIAVWEKQSSLTNLFTNSALLTQTPLSDRNIIQDFLYPQLKLKNGSTSTTTATLIQRLVSISPNPPQSSAVVIKSGNQIKVPMLMYHYIGNNPDPKDLARDTLSVTPDKFEEQIKYLKENGYQTTTLDTLYAALRKTVVLPEKSVILTFDDGYIDFYYNAFPILQKYNTRATVFIPTGLMGQKSYLTWEQIRQMQNSGLMSFEAHSVHHLDLTSLSPEVLWYEITESKKVLEAQLGMPVNFIAYPHGNSNSYVIEAVKKAGYAGALGTWPEKIQSEGTMFNMPRLRINQSVDLKTFIQRL